MPFQLIRQIWAEERPRLFLWAPVALGVGIGAYFAWPFEPSLFLACVPVAVTVIALFLARGSIAVQTAFLIALGFMLIALASRIYGTPMLSHAMPSVMMNGTIADLENREKGGVRLLLENVAIESLPVEQTPHRVHMTLNDQLARQVGRIGSGQHFRALVKPMPLSEPMVPDGFDFRRNAYFRGIGATGYALGQVSVTDGKNGWFPFAEARQRLSAEIKKTLQGDDAGIAIALLTGDQSAVSAETVESMRVIGIVHLLSVSGLHVGLAAGIVFFLTRALMALFPAFALRFPIKKIAALLALFGIVFYTLFCGAPVPTRRSMLMTGAVLLGVMTDRVSFSLRTLALAAFVILIFWPHMLLSPSFQLSFAAVLGLVSVHELMREKGWRLFPERQGVVWTLLRHGVGLAGMSFVASVATLPISLFHFQQMGAYGVLANMIAVPLTSFWLMPACVFVFLLWPFGLAEWPLRLMQPGTALLAGLSRKVAGFPGALFKPPPMPVSLLALATAGGLVFCLMVGRRRWVGLAMIALAVGLTFMVDQPLALVSADGRQIGWRDDEVSELIVASLDRPQKFQAEYWAGRIGASAIRYERDGEGSSSPLSCSELYCVGGREPHTIAWIKKPPGLMAACFEEHAVVINPTSDEVCPQNAVVLNQKSFTDHGAHAFYAEPDGLRIVSARSSYAPRPWSVR